jgi:transposase
MTMTRTKDTTGLSVLHDMCCGLDIHKKSISACVIVTDERGKQMSEVQEFGTFTDDLFRLKQWLLDYRCSIVAMESTGVYWRPIHNVLEDHFQIVLVNAHHIKNLPGRKTDISDCQWIAQLLRVGLLRGSFIPAKEIRQWRDLTRYRASLVHAAGDAKRQTHKLLESANIKIDSVASELFGRTGRNLMLLLTKSDGPLTQSDVEACLKGTLKKKASELVRAVHGFFTDHHRWLLTEMLDRVQRLEEQIARIHARLSSLLQSYEAVMDRLMAIPGISRVSAHAIVAEIGVTLDEFPKAAALCSWAGVCPGNNQSAGKRHTGRSPVRSGHLRTVLTEAAWAAVKKKESYYRSKYYSLRARLGPKKAIMAIAHRLLKAVYHVIKHGVPFRDLGEEYLLNLNKNSKINYLTRQAEKLGFKLVPVLK